jgi:hypothetical protein
VVVEQLLVLQEVGEHKVIHQFFLSQLRVAVVVEAKTHLAATVVLAEVVDTLLEMQEVQELLGRAEMVLLVGQATAAAAVEQVRTTLLVVQVVLVGQVLLQAHLLHMAVVVLVATMPCQQLLLVVLAAAEQVEIPMLVVVKAEQQTLVVAVVQTEILVGEQVTVLVGQV